MPKVSVVIPVYCVEKYIERCARSLFEQSLEDIEFIFIDDCSPDDSIRILKDVIASYPERIKQTQILYHNQNKGLPVARRTGVDASLGEFVIHCDSDDWVEPDMYKIMYEKAINNHADIVWCDFYKSDGNKDVVVNQQESGDVINSLLLGRKQGAMWNHMVKKEIVEKVKTVPTRGMIEDLVMVLQYFFYATKTSYVNIPLYHYAQNIGSISSGEDKSKLVIQSIEMQENFKLIETFFFNVMMEKKYWSELQFRKFFNKRWLLPAVDSVKNCRLWLDCHRDINFSLYRNPYITKTEKLISLLVELRLYPLLRKIIRGR